MPPPGREFYWDQNLGFLERWYCLLWGVPIIGLRIRIRRLNKLLPEQAEAVLDAGCGRGVLTRMLARRYAAGSVLGIDENSAAQTVNTTLAARMGIANCRFEIADVTLHVAPDSYDLIVSVDNLEHVQDDEAVLTNFYQSLREGGTAVIHVPHYYRRWPLFRWTVNFDVPGHVRPGYHLAELTERVRRAGFTVMRSGFSYGWLENAVNNISYAITGAREQRKLLYALAFPALNAAAWLGQWAWPRMGAGVWVVARKSPAPMRPVPANHKPVPADEDESEE
jgi:SAM-dependent methyltransferase